MIEALVFDFDGVIVDSEPLHLRAYQEVLEPLGDVAAARGVLRALSRLRRCRCVRGWRRRGSWQIDDARNPGAHRGEDPRVRACLESGDRPLPRRRRVHRAARGGLAARHRVGGAAARDRGDAPRPRPRIDYFRFIVAAGETPAGKPAPGSVPPGRRAPRPAAGSVCLAIEDSRWGIESAKAAGLWCIGITNTYPVAELLEADAIITSLDELTPELIRRLRVSSAAS